MSFHYLFIVNNLILMLFCLKMEYQTGVTEIERNLLIPKFLLDKKFMSLNKKTHMSYHISKFIYSNHTIQFILILQI